MLKNMTSIQIPHNRPSTSDKEIQAVTAVIKSGWIAQGKEVESFENELCTYFGLESGHAVVVSSGTAALYLVLLALGAVQKRVGIPVYSCTSLLHAVSMVGAMPEYYDCLPASPNADFVTDTNVDVDLVIAPSMYGIPCSIPNKVGVPVIDDIAQALGATENGRPIGLRGTAGICSFYATKMITAGGQGGLIISQDRSLIDQIRDYRQFDGVVDGRNRFNFQLNDVSAAFGRVQLESLNNFIDRRLEIYERYKSWGIELLDGSDVLRTPVRYRAIHVSQCQIETINKLRESGIRAIVPLEHHELLCTTRSFVHATRMCNTLVSIPIYPTMTNIEVDKVGSLLQTIL